MPKHFKPGIPVKNKFLILLAVAALFLPGYRLCAAEPAAAAAELKDLVTRIQASLNEGKHTEADQADHLKEFDALLARHKGETNDDVAEIAFMKATLYIRIFQQTDKGSEMLKQLQRDFPASAPANKVEQILANIKLGEEARKLQAAAIAPETQETMPPGSIFPDFQVADLDGKPLSLANYRGKVVMIDFWATWCGPCVGEVPNVAKVYEKYHPQGFEIIGVSLDREGDKDKLISFTREHNMPWRQYYDGKDGSNDLAVKYNIHSIPSAFLLDGSGKIIAEGIALRGPGLEPAVKKALGLN
jgi:thiol-disulfide isomerase/thioredoxin